MGKKIFISYKYADDSVYQLHQCGTTTARDYVDELEKCLTRLDHICKCEHDGEDLSQLDEESIWDKLRDRIYDSTVTIVLISPNMKEPGKQEREQWIPWEISYSLKEANRADNISHSNALLAIILPDRNASYSYYLENKDCCPSRCSIHHRDILFPILRSNKFNLRQPKKYTCSKGDIIWSGNYSYAEAICWCDFMKDPNLYINKACERQDHIENYEIRKELER